MLPHSKNWKDIKKNAPNGFELPLAKNPKGLLDLVPTQGANLERKDIKNIANKNHSLTIQAAHSTSQSKKVILFANIQNYFESDKQNLEINIQKIKKLSGLYPQ